MLFCLKASKNANHTQIHRYMKHFYLFALSFTFYHDLSKYFIADKDANFLMNCQKYFVPSPIRNEKMLHRRDFYAGGSTDFDKGVSTSRHRLSTYFKHKNP